MKRIVITGGHHSSAVPVINLLKDIYPELKISWFGHKYSVAKDKNTTLEYTEITEMGIDFYNLQAGKFYRTYNILRLLKIPLGFFQAIFLLIRTKPEIILSFGGYLAVPTVLAGSVLGIPSITHEQTTVVGYANKLISKFSKKVFVAWPASLKYFPNNKAVLTGIPLRKEIFISSETFALNKELPTIYITAGKTGSHKINEAVYDSLEKMLKNFNVIHQTGDHSVYRDYDNLSNLYSKIEHSVFGKYYPRRFIFSNEIGEAFSRSDFVISRSGAHTCYELAALNKPCILIPIPWVSHHEQQKNAEMLVDLGIATILDENKLTGEFLFNKAQEFSNNLAEYKNHESNKVVIYDSARKIVDEIIKVYQSKNI